MKITKRGKMKLAYILFAAIAPILIGGLYATEIPLAPEEFRRPENFSGGRETPPLAELARLHSKRVAELAQKTLSKINSTNSKGKWKPTMESLSAHRAPEWFLDAKFGLFIDWGLWSVAGWAPKIERDAMYPDWYEGRMYGDPLFRAYHKKNWGEDFCRDDFIKLFTAEKFDAKEFASFSEKVGAKYVVPFGKHHSGYCLWKSSYTLRNSVDMTPHRDLASEIASECRKKGLKFGVYFSIDEWEFPILKEDGTLGLHRWAFVDGGKLEGLEGEMSGKIAATNFIDGYILPQAAEMIEILSPDILWLDGEWDAPASKYKSFELAAYYYNINDGKNDVAVNDRYGVRPEGGTYRTVLGDFYTCEYGDTADRISMKNYHPWEACRGISQSFGFNWQDDDSNTISAPDLVWMLSDIVARGGNLLLLVNLDGKGKLPEVQRERLEKLGKWLEKNGAAIFSTRPIPPYVENGVAYTRSKDGKRTFAIVKNFSAENIDAILNTLSKNGTMAKAMTSSDTFSISDKNSALEFVSGLKDTQYPTVLELFAK